MTKNANIPNAKGAPAPEAKPKTEVKGEEDNAKTNNTEKHDAKNHHEVG